MFRVGSDWPLFMRKASFRGEKRVSPDRPMNSSAERSSTVAGHRGDHLPEMDDGSKFTWEREGSSQSEKVEQCRTASAIFALIGVIVNE